MDTKSNLHNNQRIENFIYSLLYFNNKLQDFHLVWRVLCQRFVQVRYIYDVVSCILRAYSTIAPVAIQETDTVVYRSTHVLILINNANR
jgi:hypothetical protein